MQRSREELLLIVWHAVQLYGRGMALEAVLPHHYFAEGAWLLCSLVSIASHAIRSLRFLPLDVLCMKLLRMVDVVRGGVVDLPLDTCLETCLDAEIALSSSFSC